jgi:glutamine synthetase
MKADPPPQAEAFLQHHQIQTVRVEWPDLHGLARGKYLSADHFLESLRTGVPFASASLHMDIKGDTPPLPPDLKLETGNLKLEAWPNLFALPDLNTLRLLPHEPNTAHVLADLFWQSGSPVAQSPRFALQQVVQRFHQAGFQPLLGAEIEFYLLPLTTDHRPLATDHQVHRLLHSPAENAFFSDLSPYLALLGVQCETSSAEDGPGQFELALSPLDPLSLADAAFLARNAVKEIASRHSLSATFLSKPFPDCAGSGFHLHQSLTSPDSRLPSNEKTDAPSCWAHLDSRLLDSFTAGQLSLLPDACALYLPTVNSYKRLHTRGPLPLSATWGIENRTVALRLIQSPTTRHSERAYSAKAAAAAKAGSEESRPSASQTPRLSDSQTLRLENRLPAGEANPYLVAAIALASGLYGIQNNLQPPAPVSHNAYQKPAKGRQIPPTLRHALTRLNNSKILPRLLPPELLSLFHALKSQELLAFESSTTDWELRSYLPWL